jgi:dual-specificity kinase
VQNYHLSGPIANGTSTSRLTGTSQHYSYASPSASTANTTTTTSANTAASASDLRRAATNNSRHPNTLPPIKSPSSEMSRDKRDRGRKVDWNEFYKNGVPEEIIVIDDDTPPRALHAHAATTASLTNGAARPAEKKRKTASNAYDPVYNPQPSYSTTQTPYYENSSSKNNTASTDRTTSAYITTAATSLGSQTSNGAYLPPLEDGVVGQKRKRTRAAAAEEEKGAKRRELDRQSPLSIHYIPPSKPIIKAKEVPVEVISDVRPPTHPVCKFLTDPKQKSHMKDKKVDDDDGHFIVVPDADLTPRCKFGRLSLRLGFC